LGNENPEISDYCRSGKKIICAQNKPELKGIELQE
jgi:hypothetical protein